VVSVGGLGALIPSAPARTLAADGSQSGRRRHRSMSSSPAPRCPRAGRRPHAAPSPPGPDARRVASGSEPRPPLTRTATRRRDRAASVRDAARASGRRSSRTTPQQRERGRRAPPARRRAPTSPRCRSMPSAPIPRQPRQVFDEDDLASWCTRCARSACSSRSWCGRCGRSLRADHGRAALAGRPGRGVEHDPGHRSGDRRRRPAPRRTAGEPAPEPAQPARRSRRVRPAAL
jgi:hypothetical protein